MKQGYSEDKFVLEWTGDLAYVTFKSIDGQINNHGYDTGELRKQAMYNCLKTGILMCDEKEVEVEWFMETSYGDMYKRSV